MDALKNVGLYEASNTLTLAPDSAALPLAIILGTMEDPTLPTIADRTFTAPETVALDGRQYGLARFQAGTLTPDNP